LASIDMKLKAAEMTLGSERIRWLLGKQEVLTEQKNVFGETLAKNRYQYILSKAAETEYVRNMVLSNLTEERSVHDLHGLTGIPRTEIVECIIALLRWRKIERVGMKDKSPLYLALEPQVQDAING